MSLTKEDLLAIADIMDQKLIPLNQRLDFMDQRLDAMDQRFDAMDQRLDTMDQRFDRIESRLDVIEFKQDRMAEQLKEIDGREKLFEVNTNQKIKRLQDGMDTVVEILRMKHLIPV